MLEASSRSKFDIVPWNSSFEIGIEVLDEQHRRLAALINEFAQSYVYGNDIDEPIRILDDMVAFVEFHFDTEETLWAELSVNDPLFKDHVKTHSGFVGKIRLFQSKLSVENRQKVMDELLAFLITWLAHHILYEDKIYSLVLHQVRAGIDISTAKQQAQETMSGRTSVLIQSILSMYKELSSRTLALEREAYSRQVAEQALLDQEQY
ncbi:bacteriohemerythrin [Aliidiomarina quisquiliarum]|uniref:bacteriohemerythrin n=1 Tax=Aliidiomarina quisquiliarum TaxID=2938947 RepID=UPI00208EF605|nr:hemerythrin family protein [Aliidiomarina quisquiliarum]MCO4321354.1 hemerythrin family protein [Aliidiomarina quisquiliarum]